ncbi:hypothetical protein [Pseudarthrobacter sp. CCNWLW207]|uniref:hypothetical protein n=1 Tax=Pseudarthrobacter sp. CCNWLW207 TaxID=3127468 RepID=UPI0030787D7E
MDNEMQLISDGEGVAVIGDPTAVESFLASVGLLSLSKDLRFDGLGSVLGAGAGMARAASEVGANSGRYVKLTKESAQLVKEFGLMETKTPGVSHAMLGNPGSISKWLQIENGRGSLLTNPDLLSAAAGIMAQVATQHEANELKDLLAKLDEKLDDVRRAQRDSVLAKMDAVALAIEEAMTIHEYEGNRVVGWGKVQFTSATIAEVQASALRALEALANKADSKRKVGDIAKAVKGIEQEVGLWIAVLARCFQLQDEIAVLELDQVFYTSPADLDGHRLALSMAKQKRRELVVGKTKHLMGRMDEAAGVADSNVLLHVWAARTVVESINSSAVIVDNFHAPLGIESERDSLEATRWRDAARNREQLKNAAEEAGRKALKGVAIAAATVVATVATAAVSAEVTKNAKEKGE